MINKIIELIQQNLWLAPLLSALAGFITSITPCCLFNLPLVIGYVDGIGEKRPKHAFLLSLTFSAGTFITFVVLGISTIALGLFFNHLSKFWHIVLSIVLILTAFRVWEIFPHKHHHATISGKTGYLGAILAGIIGGLFSAPCSTPILIAILAIISGTKNLILGLALMLFYSLGHNILVLVAGTSAGFVCKLKSSDKYKTLSNILKFFMGLFIFAIGILILLHAFE